MLVGLLLGQVQGDIFDDYWRQMEKEDKQTDGTWRPDFHQDPDDEVAPRGTAPTETVPVAQLSKLESQYADQQKKMVEMDNELRQDAGSIRNAEANENNARLIMGHQKKVIAARDEKISKLQNQNDRLQEELLNAREQKEANNNHASKQISELESQTGALEEEVLHNRHQAKAANESASDEIFQLKSQVADRDHELENDMKQMKADMAENDVVSRKISELEREHFDDQEHATATTPKIPYAMIGLLSLILVFTLFKLKDDVVKQMAKLKDTHIISSTLTDFFGAFRRFMQFAKESASSWMASSKACSKCTQAFEIIGEWMRCKLDLVSSRMASSKVFHAVGPWLKSKQEAARCQIQSKWELMSEWIASSKTLAALRQWLKSKRELISSKMPSTTPTEVFESVHQWAKSKCELISRQFARSPPADLKEPLLEEGHSEATNPEDMAEAAVESDSDESAIIVNSVNDM